MPFLILDWLGTDQFAGRAFAVVPRKWAPLGYRDVDQDDFKEAEPLKEWQDLLLSLGSELSVLD